MIKFEKTKVMNFDGAIRGMRNPMNSWLNSDSVFLPFPHCKTDEEIKLASICGEVAPIIGKNDLARMMALVQAGSDHRKFMRQILVSVDITAPLYWWKEFDTYKIGTVSNSCSTMHTLTNRPIELLDFSIDDFTIEDDDTEITLNDCFLNVVADCEQLRKKYLETKDKKYWRGLIQLLPESYNQKRTITLNYEVLYNIYHSQRRHHKLVEWKVGFMEWIESLPYSQLLTD